MRIDVRSCAPISPRRSRTDGHLRRRVAFHGSGTRRGPHRPRRRYAPRSGIARLRTTTSADGTPNRTSAGRFYLEWRLHDGRHRARRLHRRPRAPHESDRGVDAAEISARGCREVRWPITSSPGRAQERAMLKKTGMLTWRSARTCATRGAASLHLWDASSWNGRWRTPTIARARR